MLSLRGSIPPARNIDIKEFTAPNVQVSANVVFDVWLMKYKEWLETFPPMSEQIKRHEQALQKIRGITSRQ
jgi:hypothetical protein